MSAVTAPGVYVHEVASGVRPIEAVGSSTAAFFGEAERGPIGSVTKVFNFSEFQTHYGGFLRGRHLAHAVYQFFNNGGSACYVGRVVRFGDGQEGEEPVPVATIASVTVLDRGRPSQDSMSLTASSPGAWGNSIVVRITSAASTDPSNMFELAVHREVDGRVSPEPLESYTDLSMDRNSRQYVERIVNSQSTLIRVSLNARNSNHVLGYSEGGDVDVTTGEPLLVGRQRQFRISINNDGYQVVDFAEALGDGNLLDPTVIAEAVQSAIRALSPRHRSAPRGTYSEAAVTFQREEGSPTGRFRITAGGAPSATSSVRVQDAQDPYNNAAGSLRLGAAHKGIEVSGAAPTRPQVTPGAPGKDFYRLGNDVVDVGAGVSVVGPGSDGGAAQERDFILALDMLDTIRDVSLLAIPGIGSTNVIDAAMAYCARRTLSDCFFIGDLDIDTDTFREASTERDNLGTPNSYGAVYFPWLYMLDPSGVSSEPVLAPPSGFIAGLYGRIDARRGVWKAPAGTEAILVGAVGLAAELTDVQHGELNNNPKSICVIRRFPTTGIVAWGARTISSDPDYRYIPVRRMAILLRVSIHNGIQWAVFEPNDEPLWASLRLNIGSFLNGMFRRGAFQGTTPADAYYVKVDSETTSQLDIERGFVNVHVGFAPLKPAEFVVVEIRQSAGQAP
jgi:uncharacterized protein